MDPTVRRKPRWGAYLIGAFLFSVPAFGHAESPGLLLIPQVTGALLVGYALVDLLGRLRIRVSGDVGFYGLMGLWAGVTFFFRAGTTPEDLQSLGTLIKVVMTTWACAQLIRDEEDLAIALEIFVFSILLVYYLNSGELQRLRSIDSIMEVDRFAGTLANANSAAIYSLTVMWAAMFLLVRSRFKPLKVALYLPPIGMALLIINFAGSKKGLLGLALMSMFVARLLLIRQGPGIRRKGLVLGVSAALILVVGYFIYSNPFFFRMEQLFGGISNISDVNRLNLIKEAANVWLMNGQTFVMGVGYDQFRKYSVYGDYAHSTPMELLASNGIVGFLLFAGFLFLIWRKYFRLYAGTSEQDQKSAYFAVMIFLFIYSFFVLAAVLHESPVLLSILGCLSAYGQFHVSLLRSGGEEALAAAAT